jgi:hypothetical protein
MIDWTDLICRLAAWCSCALHGYHGRLNGFTSLYRHTGFLNRDGMPHFKGSKLWNISDVKLGTNKVYRDHLSEQANSLSKSLQLIFSHLNTYSFFNCRSVSRFWSLANPPSASADYPLRWSNPSCRISKPGYYSSAAKYAASGALSTWRFISLAQVGVSVAAILWLPSIFIFLKSAVF